MQPGDGQVGGCLMQTAIQAVDITEDARTMVAVSNHSTVYVWNPANTQYEGAPLTKFRAHPSPGSFCLHAVLAPNGGHLCTTGSDGRARVSENVT